MRHQIKTAALIATLTGSLLLAGCGSSNNDNSLLEPFSQARFSPSEVSQWNQEVLKAVTLSAPRPTVVTRSLFIIHSSIYDAWAAYDDKALGSVTGNSLRRPDKEKTAANQRAAVCYAAYHSAAAMFPAYENNTAAFSRLLLRQGLAIDPAVLASVDPATPAGLGHLAANQVLASRSNDGSNSANNFADVTSTTYPALYQPVNSAVPGALNALGGADFNLARWTPLRVPNGTALDPAGFPLADAAIPSSFSDQRFLTPHWGAVTPFALSHGAALRPLPPPEPGSTLPYLDALGNSSSNDQAFQAQLEEIVTINRDLTEQQKVVAEYWADGPSSDTPPGHWNEFAQDISFRQRFGLSEDVKLFFALNGGLLDSAISCWEAKRFYDFVRPVSAIQSRFFNQTIQGWGGPGMGTVSILGQNWRPFQRLTFVTPAFAEYASGHSTFSACGAQVLSRFTLRNDLYDPNVRLPWDRDGDGQGDVLGEFRVRPGSLTIEPGLPKKEVVLRWDTLQQAADEAGLSRRLGGIHFQDGDLRARVVGTRVADIALDKATRLFNGH